MEACVMEKQPRIVGDYELDEKIGEGGFGTVYKARHRVLGNTRAVKIPHDVGRAKAVIKEAKILYELKHPNIVGIETVNVDSDPPYIVMEYIERSLRELLKEEHYLEPRRAVRIFSQVLNGVSYAHRKGVIHKDLKPSNILLTDDETAKIADFGMAKILERAQQDLELSPGIRPSGMSVSGIGTFPYIAPEVVDAGGKGHTFRSDIYSLGRIFAEMLGRKPLSTRPLTKINTALDAYTASAFEELIDIATEDEPSKRLDSVDVFLRNLQQIEERAAEIKKKEVMQKFVYYASAACIGLAALLAAYKIGSSTAQQVVIESPEKSRRQLENLRKEHQSLLQLYETASSSLAETNRKYKELSAKFEAEVGRDYHAELKRLQSQMARLESQLSESRSSIEVYQSRLSALEAEKADLASRLSSALDEQRRKEEIWAKERDSALKKAEAESYLRGQRDAMAAWKSEIETLRREIEILDRKLIESLKK